MKEISEHFTYEELTYSRIARTFTGSSRSTYRRDQRFP